MSSSLYNHTQHSSRVHSVHQTISDLIAFPFISVNCDIPSNRQRLLLNTNYEYAVRNIYTDADSKWDTEVLMIVNSLN